MLFDRGGGGGGGGGSGGGGGEFAQVSTSHASLILIHARVRAMFAQ